MIHWLWHFLGLDNVSGFAYAFWSGFGAVILPPIFTVAGLSSMYYWHNNCHVHRCPRLGKHVVENTPYKVCRRHHPKLPDTAPTIEELQQYETGAEDNLICALPGFSTVNCAIVPIPEIQFFVAGRARQVLTGHQFWPFQGTTWGTGGQSPCTFH